MNQTIRFKLYAGDDEFEVSDQMEFDELMCAEPDNSGVVEIHLSPNQVWSLTVALERWLGLIP